MTTEKTITSEELSQLVIAGMQDKKAQDIVVMNLRNVKNAMADYFVLCSGTSDTQLDAIADAVEDMVRKQGAQWPWHKEGKENREWILLDYVDVVAHVFKRDKRDFFDLEGLWGDAELVHIDPEN